MIYFISFFSNSVFSSTLFSFLWPLAYIGKTATVAATSEAAAIIVAVVAVVAVVVAVVSLTVAIKAKAGATVVVKTAVITAHVLVQDAGDCSCGANATNGGGYSGVPVKEANIVADVVIVAGCVGGGDGG